MASLLKDHIEQFDMAWLEARIKRDSKYQRNVAYYTGTQRINPDATTTTISVDDLYIPVEFRMAAAGQAEEPEVELVEWD